jgi:hypothetical protein
VGPLGESIQASLNSVKALRAVHSRQHTLAQRVRALKGFQHARFSATYEDLLTSPRYGPAARFFLDDLYGPHDFTERDAQFSRIVPALVRLFPEEIVRTVHDLAVLHALSEELDARMAQSPAWAAEATLDAELYRKIWRNVGCEADREQQIELMLRVGEALDAFTRNPWLRHSLRLMRVPAAAAGLSELQRFLETGFDTFKAMRGGRELLDTIARRERQLAAQLFA